MLLIHDDQPEVAERQEQGRPRADHQLRAALPDHAPQPPPFGLRRARMPFGGARAEARLHPRQEFRRQRDLGQQHQRLPAHREAFGHRLQIHLGLARAGDALQERCAIAAAAQRRAQPRRALGLIGGQVLAGQAGVEPRIGQIARRLLLQHGARLDEALDHAGRHLRRRRKLGQRQRRAAEGVQRIEHPRPRLGHPRRFGPRKAVDPARARRLAKAGAARRQPQHRGQRREGVVGGAHQEGAHLGAHRGHVQHPVHRAQLGRVEPALARPPDDAGHQTRPQRHRDEGPLRAAPLRRAVVQRAAHGLCRQHRHPLALGEEPSLIHTRGIPAPGLAQTGVSGLARLGYQGANPSSRGSSP